MKYQYQKFEEEYLNISDLITLLAIDIIFYKFLVFIKIIVILRIYS